MSFRQRKNRAYREGQQARREGKPYLSNPYKPSPGSDYEIWLEWTNGWCKEDSIIRCPEGND